MGVDEIRIGKVAFKIVSEASAVTVCLVEDIDRHIFITWKSK
jgi:hypothetical protein